MVSRRWLRQATHHLHADLSAVIVYLLVTNVVLVVPALTETPLRALLGLPLLTFVPGYVAVVAIFPEANAPLPELDTDADSSASSAAGVGLLERLALAFALSIVIVPSIGLALNLTPWGIRMVPILIALSAFVLVATAVAARRRIALPPEQRFSVPLRTYAATARADFLAPDGRTDAVLNVLVVLSLLLAAGSLVYVTTGPHQGQNLTEFYLLSGESGELPGDENSSEMTAGETERFIVGVGNSRQRTVEYTAVSVLQRVENSTVTEQQELGRFNTTLAAGDTARWTHTFEPTMVGDSLRLTYLLYRGPAPTEASIETADHEVYIWIDVAEA